ncbi:50S ribosomal protein L35 [Patescibacteria group bacterium]|nr:50S ribosomal protein L35 [Patescibacteria group bacterium]
MPKLKTIQCVAKRIRITKNKKLQKKKCGQDHFNSKETGNVTRAKRSLTTVAGKKLAKNIKRFIPYSN